ncbi:MAG: MarR family transcriptional regulator [Acidimicrobiia bacterium]|nr:MarR family transcriptional regulator [Acidimicrobiia bacterium]
MRVAPSQAVEDYLKAIFRLGSEAGVVTASALAGRLGVASPSATGMLHRLEAAGLVSRGEDHSVVLTPAGRSAALRVVRRHRLIETFLHAVVGVPWHEVHDEAEVLEHALSERLEARIDELLGHPTHDPHGDPIPPVDGEGHTEAWPHRLLDVPPGSTLQVERVSDDDAAALVHLAELGLVPGVPVTVDRLDPFDGPLWVEVDGRRHALGRGLARMVSGSVR